MRSVFSAQTLAEVFRDLFLTERSGGLVLSRDDEVIRVRVEEAMPEQRFGVVQTVRYN